MTANQFSHLHLLSSPDTVRMKAILTLSLGEGGRVSLVTLTPVKWTSTASCPPHSPDPGQGSRHAESSSLVCY